MPLIPSDWNVVVLGGWNRAILTPQGIGARLFNLPADTQIYVQVPLNALGPFRVSHDGLVVMVNPGGLIIETEANNFDSLQRAMVVAHRGMQTLPETPVTAAAYNVRYRGNQEDGQLRPLLEATRLIWDRAFEDNGYPIFRREITWGVGWQNGRIATNLVHERDGSLGLTLNFERKGGRVELMEWMTKPVEEIQQQVEGIFTRVLGLAQGAW